METVGKLLDGGGITAGNQFYIYPFRETNFKTFFVDNSCITSLVPLLWEKNKA
jgi:hypothetical protein